MKMLHSGTRDQWGFGNGIGANRWPESAFGSPSFRPVYPYFPFFRQTALVTVDRAFYNPSNTASEAVVSFIRTP